MHGNTLLITIQWWVSLKYISSSWTAFISINSFVEFIVTYLRDYYCLRHLFHLSVPTLVPFQPILLMVGKRIFLKYKSNYAISLLEILQGLHILLRIKSRLLSTYLFDFIFQVTLSLLAMLWWSHFSSARWAHGHLLLLRVFAHAFLLPLSGELQQPQHCPSLQVSASLPPSFPELTLPEHHSGHFPLLFSIVASCLFPS